MKKYIYIIFSLLAHNAWSQFGISAGTGINITQEVSPTNDRILFASPNLGFCYQFERWGIRVNYTATLKGSFKYEMSKEIYDATNMNWYRQYVPVKAYYSDRSFSFTATYTVNGSYSLSRPYFLFSIAKNTMTVTADNFAVDVSDDRGLFSGNGTAKGQKAIREFNSVRFGGGVQLRINKGLTFYNEAGITLQNENPLFNLIFHYELGLRFYFGKKVYVDEIFNR